VPDLELNPITVPPKRRPRRKIVASELIASLRAALNTHERRTERKRRHRRAIQVRDDNVTKRINDLYKRIEEVLSRIKGEEVTFSSLVEKNRNDMVNTFLPLVHLEHDKRVDCRQDKPFEEIFIRRPQAKNQSKIKNAGNKILRGK
jgi:chromatin segregation and condensation protein Rec8/ScpA/Scc1 (kleisin family)